MYFAAAAYTAALTATEFESHRSGSGAPGRIAAHALDAGPVDADGAEVIAVGQARVRRGKTGTLYPWRDRQPQSRGSAT
jgi:hypothetical protein